MKTTLAVLLMLLIGGCASKERLAVEDHQICAEEFGVQDMTSEYVDCRIALMRIRALSPRSNPLSAFGHVLTSTAQGYRAATPPPITPLFRHTTCRQVGLSINCISY